MNGRLALRLVPAVACLASALLLAPPASAGGSVGVRTGLALDPDDFVIGLHFKTGPLAKSLHFVPSVEAGFGDVTMIAGNGDLHYIFGTSSKLHPYAGGGLTLNWFDSDRGDSDLEFGGSLLGGMSLGQTSLGAMFLEAKIGLGDVPDWKFVVGWNMH
jgi:hypothetical protein